VAGCVENAGDSMTKKTSRASAARKSPVKPRATAAAAGGRERRHMEPHYSGQASHEFWARINIDLLDEDRDVLYALGCVLQNIEEDVLRRLKNAEIAAESER
jgi:hypothetical protein